MGGIIRHAKAVVARSIDNAKKQTKESHEIAKASKSAVELFNSDQDIHKPGVYNFLHSSVFIRMNEIVNSSRQSSFTDVSRRSSVKPL